MNESNNNRNDMDDLLIAIRDQRKASRSCDYRIFAVLAAVAAFVSGCMVGCTVELL